VTTAFALRPASAEGGHLVALAEAHAADFATRAACHDRENSFPFENWEAMRGSGLLGGCVAGRFGGLGVTSVHDLVVAISRLAAGDAATAIAVNMHLAAFWHLSRLERRAEAAGDALAAGQLRRLLRLAGSGRAVACVAMSEAGTSLGWPATTATAVGDGYRIAGRKVFCTGSPVATLFLSSVRVVGDGDDRLGFALVPRETGGLRVTESWDALGMRASGSHDVVYQDCLLPRRLVMLAGSLGAIAPEVMPVVTVGALGLAGVALGIAERAQELIVAAVTTRRRGPGGRLQAERRAVQTLIAESEIDLGAGRAVLARAAAGLDDRLAAGTAEPAWDALMKEVQCAGMTAKRGALAVVDRALTATGGAGYLTANPLSRLYRDVRAGPFMQPFSPLEAFEYIGKVTLGLDPELDV
jgi:alkylation response protein AidB-like acyl-CoA dehydrogenase